MGLWADLKKMPPALWCVYINVTLYALCYQMQSPVQPHLVKSLGADKDAFASLRSYFSALQLAGSLAAGPLADTYGPKTLLLLNFLASAACYAITATAGSLTALYVSFLPTLLQHGVLAARAYITYVSPPASVTVRLGFTGLFYGAGIVLGPALGGQLAAIDLRLAAWMATAGSLFSVVLVALFVPDVRDPTAGGSGSNAADGAAGSSGSAPKTLLDTAASAWHLYTSNGALQFTLGLKVAFSFALALVYGSFHMHLSEHFGLTAGDFGFLMSFVGAVGMVSQAFLVRAAQRYLDGFQATALCCLLLAGAFLGYGAAGSVAHIYLVAVPLSAASSLLSTLNSGQQVAAGGRDKGTVVAVDMGLGSGVRIVSPHVTTALVAAGGWSAVGVSASAIMVGVLAAASTGVATLNRLAVAAGAGPGTDADADADADAAESKKTS